MRSTSQGEGSGRQSDADAAGAGPSSAGVDAHAEASQTNGGPLVRRSKKRRGTVEPGNGSASDTGGGAAQPGAANGVREVGADYNPDDDTVRLVPVPPGARRGGDDQEGWKPVLLSKLDKAAQMQLTDDRKSVTSWKGYRMARATHGVHGGVWYFEVTVTYLGDTGHARIGWSKKKGELQAPVGYDQYSFAYRDLEGSKVSKALREPYGEPYAQGDVIGCLICLPPGGRALEDDKREIVRWKGVLHYVEELHPDPRPLPGAFVGFSKNGVWQGEAYRDIPEGTYYPAVSLYTLPEQREGATLDINFGPDFKHAPPALDECDAAQPMCAAAGAPPPDADANAPSA